MKSWIKKAAYKTIAKGSTGVHDAWQDKTTIDAILDLIKNQEFPLRCYGMLASNDSNLLNQYFDCMDH